MGALFKCIYLCLQSGAGGWGQVQSISRPLAMDYGARLCARRGPGRSPYSQTSTDPLSGARRQVHRSHVAKDNHKNVQTCRGKYLAFLQKFYNRPSLTFPQSGEVLCGSQIRSGLANICICRLRVVALNGNNAEVFGHNYQSIKVVSPLFPGFKNPHTTFSSVSEVDQSRFQ